jgi:hypothetical protein
MDGAGQEGFSCSNVTVEKKPSQQDMALLAVVAVYSEKKLPKLAHPDAWPLVNLA